MASIVSDVDESSLVFSTSLEELVSWIDNEPEASTAGAKPMPSPLDAVTNDWEETFASTFDLLDSGSG